MPEFPIYTPPDISDIEPEYVIDANEPDPVGWDREANGPYPYPSDQFTHQVVQRHEQILRRNAEERDRQTRQGLAELWNAHTDI